MFRNTQQCTDNIRMHVQQHTTCSTTTHNLSINSAHSIDRQRTTYQSTAHIISINSARVWWRNTDNVYYLTNNIHILAIVFQICIFFFFGKFLWPTQTVAKLEVSGICGKTFFNISAVCWARFFLLSYNSHVNVQLSLIFFKQSPSAFFHAFSKFRHKAVVDDWVADVVDVEEVDHPYLLEYSKTNKREDRSQHVLQ